MALLQIPALLLDSLMDFVVLLLVSKLQFPHMLNGNNISHGWVIDQWRHSMPVAP